jgi:hypothetical protein
LLCHFGREERKEKEGEVALTMCHLYRQLLPTFLRLFILLRHYNSSEKVFLSGVVDPDGAGSASFFGIRPF